MKPQIVVFLSGFTIHYTLGSLFNVDTSLDPELLNQNQVFLNRKEKFIKFDTKDNELEIELGISVPFIKVPLTAGKRLEEAKESRITVNAPGVIVAGMLMLTSFLIIPLLFTTSSEQGFGFQRRVQNDVYPIMEGINEVLLRNGIDSSSCIEKSICWVAKKSEMGKEGSIGNWVNYLLKTWWLKRLMGGTILEKAVDAASKNTCETSYSHCSLSNKHLRSFLKMIAGGHYSN